MKGIVFTEFLEMVEQQFSPDMADDILEQSDLASGGVYTAVGTYDSGEMTALVRCLSEHVDIPVPDLLRAYGQFLFGRFYALFPQFFEGIGDAMSFLEGIESVIHMEVRKLYPDAELPRFEVTRPAAGQMVMVYRSPRQLGDLAEGLFRGALEHFQDTAVLTRIDLDGEDPLVRFTFRAPTRRFHERQPRR